VLALVEVGDALQADEMLTMAVTLFEPGSGSLRELGRDVDLIDIDEPRIPEQVTVRTVGGDSDRAVAVRAAPLAGVKSGRGVDGEERGAPARTKDVSGCSQHGELGAEASEDIAVDDRVE
jgi:hypothetical protein